MNRISLFGLLAFAIVGCAGNKEQSQNFEAVKQGMTKEEVIKLVGKPEKETNLVMVEMWKYPSKHKVIVLNSDTVVQILDDKPTDSLKQ
ncbi:outer membrane protein assembly factor BamE [Solitalea sp. MAHUQ-68]|uniref:Outer membrane protein assembly factor BamE n=1 Tax=Solitalea agri TaxID=2953739 RepID=A0A9X2F562_9SPHI|nr:outer membrane protein assembly factor BamE [Solitalea agri]MCO4294335.1 outer membrane protein assembly factor BamE [Solitalea agri]